MFSARFLCVLLGLLFYSALHAEGSCPPGWYPVGAPDGSFQVCAPIPQQAQKQELKGPDVEPLDLDLPPALFAAFAVDSGMLPYFSVDYPTRETAEAAALQSCREAGRPGCQALGTFGTGCGTFAFDLEGKIFSGVDGTMPSVAA